MVGVGLASQLSIAAIRLSSTTLRFITDIVQRIHSSSKRIFVIALLSMSDPIVIVGEGKCCYTDLSYVYVCADAHLLI